MGNILDQRRWDREPLQLPDLCFLNIIDNMESDSKLVLDELSGSLYVDICNKSYGGVLIKSEKEIKSDAMLHLHIYNSSENFWKFRYGNVKWIKKDFSNPNYYNIGVETKRHTPLIKFSESKEDDKQIPCQKDYEFFKNTKLLKFIPRSAVCPLLNRVTYKHLPAGQRLMSQGETGDACFIIQRGLCVANVEKAGKLYTVARLHAGDIVGEMAMVTGEPRNANVDAETDMDLWCLTRSQFDDISIEYPELRSFLTELVANRFASSKVTAHRTINKYVIKNIIARSKFSIVYKGVHKDLNMPVVIKMMKHDLAMDPDFLESFWNEAKIIARFNHDNIVKVYDMEVLYRTLFIIMELLTGEDLDEMLQRLKTIPFPQAVDYLVQTCTGLSHAHQQDIVHQDIKPGNLFVNRNGQLKILDFGLASPAGTKNKRLAGTIYYMAPEQLEGRSIDQRTDIYALGITAYEMVTGQRPYPEDNFENLRNMRITRDIPDPAKIVTDIPEALRAFIITACRRDPDKRYQNADQALEALQLLYKQYNPIRKGMPLERQKMTTFFMIHKDIHQPALNQIIKDFGARIQIPGVVHKTADFDLENQKMTALFLIYKDNDQLALNQIMEDFSAKVKDLGILQKAADFYTI